MGYSAFAITVITAIFPVYLPTLLPAEGVQLSIGSWSWTASALSLWGYTVSFSLFITFLISPFLGAWADEGGHRCKLLGFFSTLGALGTIGLGFTEDWKIALASFVIANIGYCGTTVISNSLLPIVAEEKDWHKVSLQAYGIGYITMAVVLAINLFLIIKHDLLGFTKTEAVHLCFRWTGIWWFLCVLPAVSIIQEPRREIRLPLHQIFKRVGLLWQTVKEIAKNRTLLLFFIAFAFYNDGIQTVINMSTIFGKQVLGLTDNALIGTLLLIQFLGLPFAIAMNNLQSRFGAKRVLVSSILFWIAIITYAYFIQTDIQFYIMGVLVAVVLGVSQSLSRSIFAGMIPQGKQTEYFSFFAISGKATAVLGPLVFGIVSDMTGNGRVSILSLIGFFVVGLIVLCFVSIDQPKNARIDS